MNDLQTLVHADEGSASFDQDVVRLDLLTWNVFANMNALAIERNIMLTIGELQPVMIVGDTTQLIQIIMSLVDNAVRYTNAGGRVMLSVKAHGMNGVLTVCDNGIGIAPNDQAHLFERFYRADPARSRTVSGSGLGLSIVDEVVRAHSGSVSVESQLGKGSTFTIMLPLHRDRIHATDH